MARLPVLGADADQWGTLLNEFLQVAHRDDGTLRGTVNVTNVRDYGATGNGTLSDSAAIQAAILDTAAQGGTLFFPPGTYLLTAALLLPSRIVLRGAGVGLSVLKLAAGVPTDMLVNQDEVNGNSHITIIGLELDGNKQENPRKAGNLAPPYQGIYAQAGIHWSKVSHSRVTDCLIHDCAWNGIVMSGSTDNVIQHCESSNNGNVRVGVTGWGQFEAFGILLWESRGGGNARNQILGCTTNLNEKHGIEILGPSHRDNVIVGCTATANNGYGIILNAEGAEHAGDILDCTCTDNAEAGVASFGRAARIDGNFLSHNAHGAFRGHIDTPPLPQNGGLIVLHAERAIVTNNTILDTLSTIPGASINGLIVSGDHNVVANNRISRVQFRGLLFDGHHNLVHGNSIMDTGLGQPVDGFGIQGVATAGTLLEGNTVIRAASHGIYLAGGGRNQLLGNQIEACGDCGMALIQVDDCLVSNNICVDNGALHHSDNRAGILLQASQRTVVTGNRCGNTAAPGSQEFGVSMLGTSDHALITGNIVIGNRAAGLQTTGTNTLVQANLES